MRRLNIFTIFSAFVILLLTYSSHCFAANHYVDNNANGANNGTSWQDAWQSFNDISWSIIVPGDIIYISGGVVSKTYYEYIHVPNGLSGIDGSPITITRGIDAGHDGVVILDGINIPNDAAVEINASSYITVSNLDLRRWLDTPKNRGTIGVFESHHIIIENNTILGWSQGVKIGLSHDCIIRNNYYTTTDSSEIQTDGIYASENYNNIYEKNYINISNAGLSHNDCFQGQLEGPCIIRYNYMIHTGGSALKAVDSQGIFDKEGNGLHQYIGNFIYLPNSSVSGQQMNDFVLGQKRPTSGSASAYVLNNTVIGASTHTFSISTDNPVVKNNLVIMLDNIAQTRYDGNSVDPGLIDNNVYYKNGTIGNEVVLGYSNFADWQSAGGDIQGMNIDPQVDSEYRTTIGSPLVDAGTNLLDMGVLEDLLGVTRPQGAAFDIGAFEIITGPDIYPPQVLSATLLDSITLKISFSEQLETSSAQNPGNYSITNGISVFSASLSGSVVTLNTSPHASGIYTVTVSNVTDLAGNVISPLANTAPYEYVKGPPSELSQLQIVNVTASVIPEPEHSPQKTIDGLGYGDGDPDSRWAGDTMPEWIMFDLGANREIRLIMLSFFNWNNGRIYNYSISVSNNINQWIEVVSNAFSSTEEWTINEFPPISARYIKVDFLSSNQGDWAGLWEGQIWGDSANSINPDETKPETFVLEQNYPNPFNPSTKIRFKIPDSRFTILKVYNVLGKEIATLINEDKPAGTYELEFIANNLPSGIYFYQLNAGSFIEMKKMVLLK